MTKKISVKLIYTGFWNNLRNNELSNYRDYEAIVNPSKQKSVVLNLTNTLQFPREQGSDESLLMQLEQQLSAVNA